MTHLEILEHAERVQEASTGHPRVLDLSNDPCELADVYAAMDCAAGRVTSIKATARQVRGWEREAGLLKPLTFLAGVPILVSI